MKTGTQPLREVNRIRFTSKALELGNRSPLAGHVSAGLQIHHPKGNKRLTFTLHFHVDKPKHARVLLTIHHGAKTREVEFPFGTKTAGSKTVRVLASPQEGMGGVHLIAVHAYVQRKSKEAKVRLRLKAVDVS